MLYLLKPGELTLKGPYIRKKAEELLIRNLKDLAKKFDVRILEIRKEPGRIFVRTDRETDIFKYLFGIKSFAKVIEHKFSSFEDLVKFIYESYKDKVAGKTFALRVRRVGKHDFRSIDVARVAGDFLNKDAKGVDLENPDIEIFVEIRNDRVYLYDKVYEAPGGLPIGLEGKVLALFSSGFDSLVSSYLIARRGAEIDFLHFFITEDLYENTLKLLKEFSRRYLNGYTPKLYVIPYKDYLKEVKERFGKFTCVVCKRTMLKIAEKISLKNGYLSIVTGENLGQVATQTLSNIYFIGFKIKVPVLRPVIGFDKDEIVKITMNLDLYDLCAKGSKISCPFKPSHPVTKTEIQKISEIDKFISKKSKGLLEKVKVIEVES